MARYKRFTFLCNRDERRLIENLAEQLQRTQSDAVRFVVVNAARALVMAEPSITDKSLPAAVNGGNHADK